jgi:nucleotide-binding universal stress UspA family protein
MGTILCPTRGGEASIANQHRAIAIAKERGAELIFLHISNVEFLDMVASPVLVDMEAELEHMGEFLLAMAQERAEKAGVQADTVVCHGVFREGLKKVIEERQATTLVLGSSPEVMGSMDMEYLYELIQWIIKEAPVEIFIVKEGEIVDHIQP